MRRAAAVFEKSTIKVIPAPTDFIAVNTSQNERHAERLLNVLPSAVFLAATRAALHEYAGLLYYRIRRWI